MDHIAGSSGELNNLQLLCKVCHAEKTERHFVRASPEVSKDLDLLITDRVYSTTPRLLADDETAWESIWGTLRNARRHRLLDLLEEIGIDSTGLNRYSDIVAALDANYGVDEGDVDTAVGFDLEAAGNGDGGFGPNSYFHHVMTRDN